MLKEGKSVGIVVGGEQEQILNTAGTHLVYVTKRRGFVRLALQHGVPVVSIVMNSLGCFSFLQYQLVV